jgi:hypothetical protein
MASTIAIALDSRMILVSTCIDAPCIRSAVWLQKCMRLTEFGLPLAGCFQHGSYSGVTDVSGIF